MDRSSLDLSAWAASGAMALTGPADGPPSPSPARVATSMADAALDLATQTARWGRRVTIDGPALLGERAAITGMTRNGSTSVGGAARFVRTADGWIALNLPRREDVESLPALVARDLSPEDWSAIAREIEMIETATLVAQASLLGVAVGAATGEPRPASPGAELARGAARTPTDRPLVIDLSSLWAGPLASSLLQLAGARVIKIEGRRRPDGARGGATSFFDLLNHGKECVAIDFDDRDDRRLLRRLIRRADLVIEGSRPRVMDDLGVRPEVEASEGVSWLSLTGHGRTGASADRVGFGDDAAVTGGLVVAGEPPMFVADAVVDPIAGLVGAALASELLADPRAAVIEVPLARAAAWASGRAVRARVSDRDGGWWVEVDGATIPVADPHHRPIPPAAAATGSADAAVRHEFPPGSG